MNENQNLIINILKGGQMTNEKNDGPEKICCKCTRKADHFWEKESYCFSHFGDEMAKKYAKAWEKACTENPLPEPLQSGKVYSYHDPVNHPKHYTRNGIEVIDFIEAYELGFRLGNAVKYIARAGEKDPAKRIEDLKKARWYLDREIVKHAGK